MSTDLEDYSLARVIKGIYNSEYKTIATDTDGNIVGVFKGDFGGTLHTIKVDSQGRMLAIVTDPEDVYDNTHMIGNTELAARLGSIITHDRRGNVVFMEDFEGSSLKWDEDHTGSGGECYLTNDRSYSGDQSLYLYTGATSGNITSIVRNFALPAQSKIGLELSFSPVADKVSYTIQVNFRDGTTQHVGYCLYDGNADKLQIYDGDWVDVATSLSVTTTYQLWCHMKVVVDYATGDYVRVIFNNIEYDVSGYSMSDSASATDPRMYIRLMATVKEAINRYTYFDNFIITQNE